MPTRWLPGPWDIVANMSTPILETKLYVPSPRPDAVFRPRLTERLDEGVHSRLMLVSAPAGFGKTTVVSDWAAGCNRLESEVRLAWLALDRKDGDPARFLTYVVAALRTVDPDLGQAVLAMLESPQPAPTESMLSALLNSIAALPYDIVLVLDDYHVLDSKAVDEALGFLVEHVPPRMHLVIATREDPLLPLARWRARGQLTELRAADLRFTSSETAEFLNRVMGLDLAQEDIAALETRTEGWIAGLQLAALSMQGRTDPAGFIQAFTGSSRFVLDYLVEEVLGRQPEHTRDFLLRTAVLDSLCGALCDAVTGQRNGRATLERLERDNLFVVPLDGERQWYRYHHLFAEVLQVHLLEEQPGEIPALHRRASEWYEANGRRSDAIYHALLAKDPARAADLIELAGPMTEDSSQSAAWLTWARMLPDELICTRPALGVWLAWALLGGGELEAAEARLQDAERYLESGSSEPGGDVDEAQLRPLFATIAVARAYNAHSVGDVPGTVKHAQQARELLPESDHPRHQQATALLGLTYWASGDLDAADGVFSDYVTRLLSVGNIPDALSAASVLPDIRIALGRLRDAVGAIEQLAESVLGAGESPPPAAADLYRMQGELDLERGDLITAAEHLAASRRLSEQAGVPTWRYRCYVAEARLSEAQGDLQGALALLDEAERVFVRTPLPEFRPIAALKARVLVEQGRLAEAAAWARERGLSADDALSYLREFEHMTLARLLIAQHKREGVDDAAHGAMTLLERLLHAAEAGGRAGGVIEILALKALVHEALGDTPSALAALDRASAMAEPEGYARIFIAEGPPMASLLNAAAAREVAPDSARRLLAAFPSAGSDRALPYGTRREVSDLLSEREIEVLTHIAAGSTNRQIAAALYLSPYTVKAHARSIYDKLDAHNRTQAVARARELGVLPLL